MCICQPVTPLRNRSYFYLRMQANCLEAFTNLFITYGCTKTEQLTKMAAEVTYTHRYTQVSLTKSLTKIPSTCTYANISNQKVSMRVNISNHTCCSSSYEECFCVYVCECVRACACLIMYTRKYMHLYMLMFVRLLVTHTYTPYNIIMLVCMHVRVCVCVCACWCIVY